jgi:glycosyltransferase involved in cell wall biosynthesis
MRYWIITTEYPPQFGGGIATYVSQTAQMLQNQGHAVSVFISDLSLSQDKVAIINGIRLIRFVPKKTYTNAFLGFNAYISYEFANIIGEYIKADGVPDILESQEYHGIAYYIQQFKLLRYEGFKEEYILITCSAPSFLCLEYNQTPLYKFPDYWTGVMEKSVIKSADILISPSEYFIEEAKKRMHWDEINCNIIPNPIPVVENKTDYNYKKNEIVCFGKLSPLKGTFELLQYFKELWDGGFSHPLYIVGGTDQFFHPANRTMHELVISKYKNYIKSGLLVLKGELSPELAKEYIKDAHVIIVPSIFDNFPYTVLEAMSMGKIVLASIQGGQREIITDNHNGFLFDHSLPGDFNRKLKYILSLPEVTINQIAEKAVACIRSRYSPDIIYEKKISIIEAYYKEKKSPSLFPFVTPTALLKNEFGSSEENEILSIVVPYFNMGEFIEECIQSITKSLYHSQEIIIVDDGSTDNSSIQKLIEIEEKYAVKVYRKVNEGLSKTRNYGANIATGKYLAFLDADDTVEPSYYLKAIQVLNTYRNIYFIGCWTKYTGSSDGAWPTFNPEPPYLLLHNMVNSSALVYKREAFLAAGLNNPEMIYGMEDWDSVISIVKHGYRGVVLPELLFNYRVRKDSMARSFTRNKLLHLQRLISKNHINLYNQYGSEIFQLLNANGSSLYFDNPTFESPSLGKSLLSPLNSRFKEKLKQKVKQNKYIRKIAYKIYRKLNNIQNGS